MKNSRKFKDLEKLEIFGNLFWKILESELVKNFGFLVKFSPGDVSFRKPL